jgi:hypothetical protein
MSDINQILLPILTQFLFITGFALLLFSMVIGVMMLLKPSAVIELNRRVSTLVSLRRSTKSLETPRYVDNVFYSHHKILGSIVTLTSAYVLYYFSTVFDANIIAGSMAHGGYDDVPSVLLNAVQITMLLTSLVSLVIGVIVFIRPSQLKGFESWSNHWVSTRRASRALVEDKDQIDQLAYKNPKLVGSIVICLSIYAVAGLFLIYIN